MSSSVFAKFLKCDVDRVRMIEDGEVDLDLYELELICRVLRVEPNVLLP